MSYFDEKKCLNIKKIDPQLPVSQWAADFGVLTEKRPVCI